MAKVSQLLLLVSTVLSVQDRQEWGIRHSTNLGKTLDQRRGLTRDKAVRGSKTGPILTEVLKYQPFPTENF
jgi:hypothetical protein